MTDMLMLGGALLFPVAGLFFLLWLARIEDTLPRDVRSAQRRPAPAPILAVPVRRRPASTFAVTPQSSPASVPASVPALSEVATLPVVRASVPEQRAPAPVSVVAEAV